MMYILKHLTGINIFTILPHTQKKSVVYSQSLRLCCICSKEKDFDRYICKMKSWFSQRRYPQKQKNETSKVKFLGQTVFHMIS